MNSTFKLKIISGILILICLVHFGYAQKEIDQQSIENEIDLNIWKPFKQTYESRDWEGFNELHADDVLRVHDGGMQIGESYKSSIKESYQNNVEYKVTIDFAMERRTYEGNTAYEVGFYRVVYNIPNKEPRFSYGRFHVVLKKINGQWKIAQDWDSNSFNGEPIAAEDFNKATFLSLED